LVATVAPGGRGKSLLSHVESLAMITGRPLLGESPLRRLRVLMMNYEDHQDELGRRFEAARKHYGVSKEDVRGRIIIEGVKADVMCFAKEDGDGVQIAALSVATVG
jgi:RecA-family ATPase